MKNVVKGIIFVLILFVLIETVSFFLIFDNNIKKYGMYKKSAYEILNEEENSIDALVVGDSLIYSSVSPMEIWDNFGYTVYDCANPAQILPETYEYLNVAVESQKPKIVFLEANVLFRDPKKKKFHNIAVQKIENYIPIIKYHNNWKKLILKNNIKGDTNKGYKYITKKFPAKQIDYMKYTSEILELPKGNIAYFEKIIKLCTDNNIKLVLIGTPSQKSWNYSKYVKVTSIANEYNLEFLDLNTNNPLNIDWENDTKDYGSHLNCLGAKKVSLYLGNYLQSINLLVDHRDDSNYKQWNDNYVIYENNSNCN